MTYDVCVKIVIIGDASVGKSSLLRSMKKHTFESVYQSTIGVDFDVINMELDDKIYKIQLWDTAGQEKFYSIIKTYFNNVAGCIVVFDITNINSFNNLDNWINDLELYNVHNSLPKILIGNKCDLKKNRIVGYEKGLKFANSYNMKYLETSAKEFVNVDDILYYLVQNIREHINEGKLIANKGFKLQTKKVSFILEENLKKKKKCC